MYLNSNACIRILNVIITINISLFALYDNNDNV